MISSFILRYYKPIFLVSILTILSIFLYAMWYDLSQGSNQDKHLLNLNSEMRISTIGLYSQLSMARYAFWQMISSFVGLIVSLGGIYFVYESLKQTRKSLIDSERFGIAEATAYVVAKEATCDMDGNVVLQIANTGRTAANLVYVCLSVVNCSEENSLFPLQKMNSVYSCNLDPNGVAIIECAQTLPLPVGNEKTYYHKGGVVPQVISLFVNIEYTNVFNIKYRSYYLFKLDTCSKYPVAPTPTILDLNYVIR